MLLFIINLIGYDIDPAIKRWIYIILLAVSLWLLAKEVSKKVLVIIPAVVLALFITVYTFFLGPATFVNFDGEIRTYVYTVPLPVLAKPMLIISRSIGLFL